MGDVPLTFGEWQPDMAPHMSPALAEAENVLPVAGAYAPFPAHVPIGGAALPEAACGFFATLLTDASPAIYAATRSKVYRIANGSTGLAYDAGALRANRWWFDQMDGRIIAGCEGLPPVGGAPGSSFTPLGGTPPAAACGKVINRYLVLGNLTGEPIDGTCPTRIRWSGIGNPDTWGTNVGTGADFDDLDEDGGPIIAISGRTFGTIFQRKSISRLTWTGGARVFDISTIEINRGAVSAGAVCDIGALAFYRADDGFFAWDGTQSVPIGTNKVDDWFAKNADPSKFDLMSAGYDPIHRCAMWAFTEMGQTANSAILAYSLADNKFTLIRSAMEQIGASATLPARLEDMPTPDTAAISWDDGLYSGKRPVLAGIDGSHTYGTFSGDALAAKIVTGDFQAAPGQRSFVNAVRPIIDASAVQIAIGEREQATRDSVAWAPPTSLGVDGRCPQRRDARYLRYRQTVPAGAVWTRSSGLEVSIMGSGLR